MPIYEFYCPQCHTIFSFLSRSINTAHTPPCPHDGSHALSRKVSRFAHISAARTGSDAEQGGMDELAIDEGRMMSAMESLAAEAQGLDENDPRAAAALMRKLSERTGLDYGDTMEEALARLESGEDPQAIESQLGESLEGDELPFKLAGKKGAVRKVPPRRDDALYEM